jgi:hypothetical protein
MPEQVSHKPLYQKNNLKLYMLSTMIDKNILAEPLFFIAVFEKHFYLPSPFIIFFIKSKWNFFGYFFTIPTKTLHATIENVACQREISNLFRVTSINL